MRSQRFPSLRRVRALFASGLRQLGRLFKAPAHPPAVRRGLADLMPLEDRRLLSAVPIGPEFRVNTFTTGQQTLSAQTRQAVAADAAGDSVVVWASQNQDGNGWGVYGQRLDPTGSPVGGEFRVNTTTQDDQTNPAVALDAAGNFVVAWQSHNQGGPGWDVYAQRYNTAGSPLGGEFRVNTTTALDQTNPAVGVAPTGGFLVVWQSQNGRGNKTDILAQRYDSAGIARGGEFQVNSSTAKDDVTPAVTADGAGNYDIAWESSNPSGNQANIYLQLYDSAGTALGGESQVNTTTGGSEQAPTIVADAAGAFVIAWQSQGASGWDVFAQRFNTGGGPAGGEFRVNTTTAGDQVTPAVALDGSGNFVVSWASQGQDNGGSWGVYGQHYSAAGNAQGGEFLVNTTTLGDQQNPAVGMDSGGNFLVAWSGNGTGDAAGVFGQRYAAAGITVTPTAGLQTTAAGGTATFTVVLDTQPTANVTFGLSSSDTQFGTVSTSALTFTPADWNAPQTVTITGVNSLFRLTGGPYTIVTAPAVSTDSLYNGLDPADVQVTNVKGAGILVTPTAGLRTTQAGGTASFNVVLNTAPLLPVTVGLSSSDPSAGVPSTSSLVFTGADWNVPQTVTVTGVNNQVANGDQPYTIVTAPAQSLDLFYSGINAPDVALVNTSINTSWVNLTPTSLVVPASGSQTATFTVALTSRPLANVTVPLSSDDPAAGTPSVGSLTFTPTDWNQLQTVTVTGSRPGASYDIVTGPLVSADPSYDSLAAGAVSVLNQAAANIIVRTLTPPQTSADSGQASFSVALQTAPSANVTIALSSSDATLGVPSVSSLTFTPANWNQPQTVTVTGSQSYVAGGDQPYTILTAPAVSADPVYSGLDGADVTLVSHNPNLVGLQVAPPWQITQAGGTVTFQVALTSQPTANVTIPLSSSDPAVGNVTRPSVTFTPGNWNVPQTITVNVTSAAGEGGDFFTAFTITPGPATSADPGYRGLQADDLWVIRINGNGGGGQNHGDGKGGGAGDKLPSGPGGNFPGGPGSGLPTGLPPDLVHTLVAGVSPTGSDGSGVAGGLPGVRYLVSTVAPALHGSPGGSVFTASGGTDGLVRQLSPADVAFVSAPPPVPWTAVPASVLASADTGFRPNVGTFRNPGTPGATGAYPLPPDAYLLDATSAGIAHAGMASASTAALGSGELAPTQPAQAWAAFSLGLGGRLDSTSGGRPEGVALVGATGSLDLYALQAGGVGDSPPQETGRSGVAERGASGRRLLGASSHLAREAHERAEEPLDLADPTPAAAPAAVTGLAATAGYVLLNTRAGTWLLGALAARPLWRQFDPLEVLFAWEDKQGQDDDDGEESLLSLVE